MLFTLLSRRKSKRNSDKEIMNYVFLVSVIISLYFFNGNATILITEERRCHGKISISPPGSRSYKGLSHNVKKTKIPSKFDARKKWPKCKSLFRISDQGKCGGCWAFSSSSVMADRLCIHSKQKLQHYVSTQDLLECCKKCVAAGDQFVGGCGGGYADDAFDFWRSNGIVTGFDRPLKGCKPMNKKIVKGTPSKTCQKQCTNKKYKKSYNNSKTFGLNVFVQSQPLKNGLKQIQIELMKNGPIVAFLNAYDYFADYGKNDTISYNKEKVGKKESVVHAIKIIGWDVTEDGTPVWIIANSWGTEWCDSGFCRVKRGVNELNIEEYPMIAGLPRLKSASLKRAPAPKDNFGSVRAGSGTFTFSFSVEVILTLFFFFSK